MAKNPLKKLLSDTAIYGASSIIGRFLNYLLVPLYTYKIAAESGGYGVVTNMYAYTGLILVLLTFGMETTFFRFSNKEKTDPNKTFSTALIAVGSVALLFVALITIFLTPISNAMNYANHPEYIEIMAIIVALDAFQAILFSRVRYEERPKKFAALKLLFIGLNILLNLFVILWVPKIYTDYPSLLGWYRPEDQVRYIFVVNLICTSIVTFGFIPELKHLRNGMDWSLLKKMLKYSWPLLLLGLAGILNQVADKILYRYIVPGKEGEVQLGIYGACVKIAMIMAMITQAFRYAYEPIVFSNGKDEKSKEDQAVVMKYFVIATMMAFLAVMMYLDLFKYVINKDYWEGLKVIPIAMMAEVFMGIYFNLSFWYKLTDDTKWGAIFSGIGCAVLVAINFIFVPKYGYMACAWGGFAGYGICMLLSYLVGQKRYYVPYEVGRILLYMVIAVALYFISTLTQTSNMVVNLIINTLYLIAFMVIAYYMDIKKVFNIKTFLITHLKH